MIVAETIVFNSSWPGATARLGAGSVTASKLVIKYLAIGAIGAATVYVALKMPWRRLAFETTYGNSIFSRLVDQFSSDVSEDHRQLLRDMPHDVDGWSNRNHSHPVATSTRSKANALMQHFVRLTGQSPYHYQMSKGEQSRGVPGSRTVYFAKDLQTVYQNDNMAGVTILTDVDYYLDMPKIMNGQDIIMYTFVPTSVAGRTDNGVYTINSNDEVETCVNGGAKYLHRIWDYDDDHLISRGFWKTTVYLVEQIQLTRDRRLILLNHSRTVYGPIGWLIPGRVLTRKRYNYGGVLFNRFMTSKDGQQELICSMGRVGEYDSINIPSAAFTAAYIRLSSNKDPHLSDVERYFNSFGVSETLFAASLFFDVFRRNPEVFGEKPRLLTPGVTPHDYQSPGPLISEDGKSSMRLLWPGYSRNAFSPVKSSNNDVACLKGRIEEPKNRRPRIPPVYYTFFDEFLIRLVPESEVHTLSPTNYEQVWEQFDRPNQRSLLATADYNMDPCVFVKSFQKREPYGKITSPRNISTLPMGHNATLAQYTMPFLVNILKKTHWYAFGKHPREFVRVMRAKAESSSFATSSDFNKLDGSIRGFFRDLFVSAYVRAYHPRYHPEFRKLEAKERHAKAFTSFGHRYDTDSTVLSGSSDTSQLGTLTNAFIAYTAYRYTLDPQQAWDKLGLYGGDDGVSFDLVPEHMERAAAKYGLACECERSLSGQPVKFLGRIYIDPWTTDQSMADVPRQMRKVHLTTAPDIVPDYLVLYRKAFGYAQTDSNTPLLTSWASAVLRLTAEQHPEQHRLYKLTVNDRIYWSKFDMAFEPPTDIDYAYSLVSKAMNLTIDEIRTVEQKFKDARVLKDLYLDPFFDNDSINVTIPVVHRGELLSPRNRRKIPTIVKDNAKKKVGLCRFVAKGQRCPYPKCLFTHTRVKPRLDNRRAVTDK